MSAALQLREPTALAVIHASEISTIIAADKSDILGKLAARLAAHVPDISTEAGRKEISRLGDDVATGKMDLVRLANGLTEGWRASTKAVLEERKIIEERMDGLKVQVLAPLTEFKAIEKNRIAGHERAIADIVAAGTVAADASSAEVAAAMALVNGLPVRDFQEFTERARQLTKNQIDGLNAAMVVAQRREAQAAELARLQAEEVERNRLAAIAAQAEREKQIALDAAAEATRRAEEAAARQHAETLRVAAEARAEIERGTQAERDAAETARLANERREQAAAKAASDAIAKQQADHAAHLAKIDADNAAEMARINAEMARERRDRDAAAAKVKADADAECFAAEARAKDKAHRRTFNIEARDMIVLAADITEAQATLIVTAIAKGAVPHCTLTY
jgi:colicin import membrane protein